MRTLFISSFHPHISRNILHTPVLRLVAAHPDLRIVIVVPDYKVEYFREHFAGDKVVIEGVKQYQSARTFAGLFFKRLSRTLLHTGTTVGKRRYKFYWDRKLGYMIAAVIAGFFGRSFLVRRLARRLDLAFSPAGFFFPLLDLYSPAAVFSTDIHNDDDVALMQDARRRGIPIIGMWRSWDNPTQQMLRVFPELLLIGSEELRRETAALHRFPEARIAMTGHPHYDRYPRGPIRSRDEFCALWGMDPQRGIILYAAGGDKIIRENDIDQYVIETLGGIEANVIVRYPPGEDIRLVNFTKPANVVIDLSGHRFAARRGEFEIRPEDDDNLIDQLYWSDVIISGPTSVLLDGAFMDKPVIAGDFHPRERRSRYQRSWGYLLDHIHKLFSTGGVWYAGSREQFLKGIEVCLSDRELHSEGRAKIRGMWFSHADGRASRRAAEAIDGFLL